MEISDTKGPHVVSTLVKKEFIEEIKKMKLVSKNHKSSVYEKDGMIYKLFDEGYVHAQGGSYQLEGKLLLSGNLRKVSVPEKIFLVRGTDSLFSHQFEVKGYSSKQMGKKFVPGEAGLEIMAKRYIDFTETLKVVNNENVVITDAYNYDNLRVLEDDTLGVIDYDGMQVKSFTTNCVSKELMRFISNNYDIEHKYKNGNYYTKDVNVLNLIALYLADTLSFDISWLNHRNIDFIDKLGIENKDVKNKILKLFTSEQNEFFTDSELCELSEKYHIEENPYIQGTKRFVKN